MYGSLALFFMKGAAFQEHMLQVSIGAAETGAEPQKPSKIIALVCDFQ